MKDSPFPVIKQGVSNWPKVMDEGEKINNVLLSWLTKHGTIMGRL